MSLDRCGQLYGQLIQICDVHKGITIDSLDVLFVLADSGRNEQYSLAPVLLPDAAEIFLGGTAVVTGCCRLTIGYKDQDLYLLRRLTSCSATKRSAAPSRLLPRAAMSIMRYLSSLSMLSNSA